MELAVEAAQSRNLADFLGQFALRSTRMLDAHWGGVAVYRGRETELHAMPGGVATTEAVVSWLISSARASQSGVEARAIPKEIAAAWSFPEEPGAVVFVRIAASDNERLGTLCLIRNRKTLGADEKRLLHGRISGDSRNWSAPSGSGWKTLTRLATTSWCTTARGTSFERTGRWQRIWECRR